MAQGGAALEIIDKAFGAMTQGSAILEVLYDQCRWAEGPVWFGDGQYLVWSDIPNNRLLRWTPDGTVAPFREPSNYINGNTRDREADRRTARIVGWLFIGTFVFSVPGLLLYGPVLNHADYVLGAGHDTQITLGAFLGVPPVSWTSDG